MFSVFLRAPFLHFSHYLQPRSLVAAEEEQSHYSTPLPLHPPLCLWCRLWFQLLKFAHRITVSQLPPSKPDSQHALCARFTSSLSENKTAGSSMPQWKRSPSTATLPLIFYFFSLCWCEIIWAWACEIKTRVLVFVHANVCRCPHFMHLLNICIPYSLVWCRKLWLPKVTALAAICQLCF